MKSRYNWIDMLSKKQQEELIGIIKDKILMEYQQNATALDLSHNIELYSAICLMLNETFGFGEKRQKQAIYSLNAILEEIHKTYELAESETGWICTQKMKERGFDVEAWVKEIEKDGMDKC